MIAFLALLALAAIDLALVACRARREWARSDELSPATAAGITSLYLLSGALTAVALAFRPLPIGAPLVATTAAGAVVLLAGLVLAGSAARLFGSSARLYGVQRGWLIEGGVYRVTRNPQYIGLVLVLAGIGVLARSGLVLGLSILFAAGLWFWVTAIEEPHLRRAFGDRYRRYCATVPRFLGVPRGTETRPSRR